MSDYKFKRIVTRKDRISTIVEAVYVPDEVVKQIRSDAIDDFVHECDKHCEFYSGKNKSITREEILKIAEQVKEQK